MPALLDRIIERPRNKHHEAQRHALAHKVLAAAAIIALLLQTSLLLVSLFEQPLAYNIGEPGSEAVESPDFLRVLTVVTGGVVSQHNRVTVLTNGNEFYPAELDAIRHARSFIGVECYILQKGQVAEQLVQALEERARAGVRVRMVIDAVGSTALPDSRFDTLRSLGGRVAFYHRIRWYQWARLNNRTHREIVVVDGTTAFAGGAGFADQWLMPVKKDPQWRDTVLRFEGEAAAGLHATFAENWLESSGELLADPKYYPAAPGPGDTTALVVTSSPTSGRSTEARALIQSLLAKAGKSIHITNPYFLPDKHVRRELVRAAHERGVNVEILVPGKKNDHLLTRRSSRELYGDLLLGGAHIFEYEPSMIHAKILLVDGYWSVVGSTNFDSRSFALNDEVNVAMPDPAVNARLEEDFQNDLRNSREISYAEWKSRPWWEKVQEWFGWLLQNQE